MWRGSQHPTPPPPPGFASQVEAHRSTPRSSTNGAHPACATSAQRICPCITMSLILVPPDGRLLLRGRKRLIARGLGRHRKVKGAHRARAVIFATACYQLPSVGCIKIVEKFNSSRMSRGSPGPTRRNHGASVVPSSDKAHRRRSSLSSVTSPYHSRGCDVRVLQDPASRSQPSTPRRCAGKLRCMTIEKMYGRTGAGLSWCARSRAVA